MAKTYQLTGDQVRRVAAVVKAYENPQSHGTNADRPSSGPQCVVAKLTSKSGNLYAWSQYRWDDGTEDYVAVSGGLSGTTSARSAIGLQPDGDDLTDQIVILVRGTMIEGGSGDEKVTAWYIAGSPSGGSSIEPGAYQGMVYSTLASNSIGWNFPVLHETF